MVCVGTRLLITDNTGALEAACIKILGSTSGSARLGDRLIVAIKRVIPDKKIKAHEVRTCVLVRTRRRTHRRNGMSISFSTNAVVLIDHRRNPLGSRIFGAVAQELRTRKQMKLLTIAQHVV
jgi:large subunit ribosomal protein L14